MPGGDQTGPLGQGPMTGRAAGYCAGYNQPGWMNPIGGRGFGRGWGGGRGGWHGGGGRGWRHRHWFYATGLTGWQRAAMNLPAWGGPRPGTTTNTDQPALTQEQELAWLKERASQLESDLGQIRSRMEALSKVEAKSSPSTP